MRTWELRTTRQTMLDPEATVDVIRSGHSRAALSNSLSSFAHACNEKLRQQRRSASKHVIVHRDGDPSSYRTERQDRENEECDTPPVFARGWPLID